MTNQGCNGVYGALSGAAIDEEINRRKSWLKQGLQNGIAFEMLEKDLLCTNGTIVDVGSGIGERAILVARSLPKSKVLGLEVESELVKKASSSALSAKCSNIEFKVYDGVTIPLGNDTVDAAAIDSVIWVVPHPTTMLDECYRILRPGGSLGVRNFDTRGMRELSTDLPGSFLTVVKAFAETSAEKGSSVYRGRSIVEMMRRSGFHIVHSNIALTQQTFAKNGLDPLKKLWMFYDQWKAQLVKDCALTETGYAGAKQDLHNWFLKDGNILVRTIYSSMGVK